ncbi:MAG: hypothetical protein QXS32_09090 [Candidatus Nezhaarchaeales archaeon]
MSTCHEALCSEDGTDVLYIELSTLKNIELTAGGSPQLLQHEAEA